MNTMLFPEDIANVIQSFCLCNDGDEAAINLILAVGSELLDISTDMMLEMVNDYEYWKTKQEALTDPRSDDDCKHGNA